MKIGVVQALEEWLSPDLVHATTTPAKKGPAMLPTDAPSHRGPNGTVQCPLRSLVWHTTPREPPTMLQRQSPGELLYWHRKSVYRAPPSNGRLQQTYIFGRSVNRAVDLLRRNGTTDCSCQAMLVKRYGHRLLSSCLRYPTFLSEMVLCPTTCQTLCAVHRDPPGWCHGSAT